MLVEENALKRDARQPDWRSGLARAAALGLLVSGCQKETQPEPVSTAKTQQTEGAVTASSAAKDCCMGKNDCKGKGGCAVAESHACAGQNDCKGKGGCSMHCPK
jgi:hypothetical protein